jgi:hypothetical protein
MFNVFFGLYAIVVGVAGLLGSISNNVFQGQPWYVGFCVGAACAFAVVHGVEKLLKG